MSYENQGKKSCNFFKNKCLQICKYGKKIIYLF